MPRWESWSCQRLRQRNFVRLLPDSDRCWQALRQPPSRRPAQNPLSGPGEPGPRLDDCGRDRRYALGVASSGSCHDDDAVATLRSAPAVAYCGYWLPEPTLHSIEPPRYCNKAGLFSERKPTQLRSLPSIFDLTVSLRVKYDKLMTS